MSQHLLSDNSPLTHQFQGLLFGDISAVVLNNRLDCLKELLSSQHLHRLVNGSDYPLVAAQVLISTRLLKYNGSTTHHWLAPSSHMLSRPYHGD